MPENPTPPQTAPEVKLEIPENTTPEQTVVQLETEANALTVLPDIREVKGLVSDDIRAFARRMEERVKTLNDLLDNEPKNPEFDMAKQLIEWENVKYDLTKITKFFPEYATRIDEGRESFDLTISGEWPRIQRIFIAAKKLEAYLHPLIKSEKSELFAIRAIIATLNGTVADFQRTFQPHGVEVDKVQILSPVPGNVKINRQWPEDFLVRYSDRGQGLPLKQMHNLIQEKAKASQGPIITDLKNLGWNFQGERRRETEVIVYDESIWQNSIRTGPIREFRSQ